MSPASVFHSAFNLMKTSLSALLSFVIMVFKSMLSPLSTLSFPLVVFKDGNVKEYGDNIFSSLPETLSLPFNLSDIISIIIFLISVLIIFSDFLSNPINFQNFQHDSWILI